MTVSSQIANPSLTPPELDAQSLAQLDSLCGNYLLYPRPETIFAPCEAKRLFASGQTRRIVF